MIGSCVGPAPYPELVRELQAVIGREAREQLLEAEGALPEAVVACVGGGSNAIGMFAGFVDDADVRLVGVEAAGAASLGTGRTGVLHGSRSSILADEDGQIADAHSISAGLDYPGVGPEHAWLRDTGRAEYLPCTDEEALDGVRAALADRGDHPRARVLARARGGRPARRGVHRRLPLRAGRQGSRGGAVRAGARPTRRMTSKTLVIYLVCGPETPDARRAAVAGGADIIELGFPFSDPLADGPVIRAAAERALAPGCAPARASSASRRRVTLVGETPIVPMTYASLLEAYGWERFAADAARARRDEPHRRRLPAGQRPELRRIQLVAPTSTDERIGSPPRRPTAGSTSSR